jgi:hypothetical protein
MHQSALLLRPIYAAQLRSILAGPVIAIDETTIRAGRSPNAKGKMHSAYFWPIYGHLDEVAFHFAKTRSHTVLDDVLKDYSGTAITDGYGAYERFGKKLDRIQRAQCWSHYLESAVIRSAGSLHHDSGDLEGTRARHYSG